MYSEQFEIELFVDDRNRCPAFEWIETLDRGTRGRVLNRLRYVTAGNLGKYESLKGGVFELKIDFGPGYRVYFGKGGSRIIILPCAGDKSNQQKDIERAKYFWRIHKAREPKKYEQEHKIQALLK